MQGVFADENSNEITIASNSTLKSRKVVFYGEDGGVKKMKNRNLPDIEIIELSEGQFLEKKWVIRGYPVNLGELDEENGWWIKDYYL